MDNIVGKVRPTTSVLNPWPSWLIKATKGGLAKWVKGVVNAWEEVFYVELREGLQMSILIAWKLIAMNERY